MILAIETSSQQLGTAVVDGERLVASYEVLAEHPHAVELPEAVRRVLHAAHTTLEQLEAVVVDIGPGSFTGLRIGVAFVKALVFPRKTPVVGVPSLDVLAAQLPWVSQLVCPLLDAKRKNVYAALYRLEAGIPARQMDYFLGPVDEVLAQIKPPVVFLGDGCALYRERMIERLGPQAQFAAPEFWLPRAGTLARLGRQRLLGGQREDPSRLVPMYLYPQDCSVRLSDRPAGAPHQATPTAA